jgi:hypothetical protein
MIGHRIHAALRPKLLDVSNRLQETGSRHATIPSLRELATFRFGYFLDSIFQCENFWTILQISQKFSEFPMF